MTTVQNPKTRATDFSGYLCASDLDGTLITAVGAIMPRRNREAVARFRAQGGRFTIASGRSAPSIARKMFALGLEDTPAIALNGAAVYDCRRHEFLSYHAIPPEGVALAVALCHRFPGLQFQVHKAYDTHFWHMRNLSFWGSSADRQTRHHYKNPEDIAPDGWGKCIFYGARKVVAELEAYCRALPDAPLTFMNSSRVSLEATAPGVDKGSALLELAEILGIDKAHTAGIGNADNDAGLVQRAAFSGAAGQAREDFRRLADVTVCDDKHGAVADFLDYFAARIVADD
ncbi:MAG: Cof-type HAD-IIB family hydrolase [Oscillospiraceae bacterium]|jgi:Cof subfamily protein (haloacid dehalogenase superfamily)|nr:Cof-type HAD-IIB family hydrolase [Oscillospiraceae bacterium]